MNEVVVKDFIWRMTEEYMNEDKKLKGALSGKSQDSATRALGTLHIQSFGAILKLPLEAVMAD